jgi:hypothetical protein
MMNLRCDSRAPVYGPEADRGATIVVRCRNGDVAPNGGLSIQHPTLDCQEHRGSRCLILKNARDRIGGERTGRSKLGPLALVPCWARRQDGTVGKVWMIVQFRETDQGTSCVIYGMHGYALNVKE